jgi:hypothetical protein
LQPFVVHLDGTNISFYWATFTYDYVNTIRNVGTPSLAENSRIQIHHSKPHDLLIPTQRGQSIRDFVAVVRFAKEGFGKVGYFYRESKALVTRQHDVPRQPPTPPRSGFVAKDERASRTDDSDAEAAFFDAPLFVPVNVYDPLSLVDLNHIEVNEDWYRDDMWDEDMSETNAD